MKVCVYKWIRCTRLKFTTVKQIKQFLWDSLKVNTLQKIQHKVFTTTRRQNYLCVWILTHTCVYVCLLACAFKAHVFVCKYLPCARHWEPSNQLWTGLDQRRRRSSWRQTAILIHHFCPRCLSQSPPWVVALTKISERCTKSLIIATS